MKKIIAYSVAAGVLAAASLVAAAPAYAAASTLTLDDTTDWTPGQMVTATLVDTGDSICTNDMVGNEWALGLEVYNSDNVLIGGAYATEAQGSYATGQTWSNVELEVGWLNADVDSGLPTYNMDVHVVGVCQNSPVSTSTNVESSTVNATYRPISVTSATAAQGGSTQVTVTDASGVWCDSSTGSGYSMGFGLVDANDNWIYIPIGLDAGSGIAGLGSFTWDESTPATVTLTIPATVPVGKYTLFAGCVTDSADGYQQPGPGMTFADFEVTPALPDTGFDNAGTAWTIGAVSATLLALGAGMFFIRRRLS